MEQAAAAVAESLGARGAADRRRRARHLACWAGRRERAATWTTCGFRADGAGGLSRGRRHCRAHGRRGLRAQPPRGAPGAPRRPAAWRRRQRASSPSRTSRWRRCSPRTPEAARRFAERELGPARRARATATLRLASTVAVFLEEGASFVRAARRLGVHANTVAYRVRRAEAAARPPGDRAPAGVAGGAAAGALVDGLGAPANGGNTGGPKRVRRVR